MVPKWLLLTLSLVNLSLQIVLQTMMEYPEIETCVEVSITCSSIFQHQELYQCIKATGEFPYTTICFNAFLIRVFIISVLCKNPQEYLRNVLLCTEGCPPSHSSIVCPRGERCRLFVF